MDETGLWPVSVKKKVLAKDLAAVGVMVITGGSSGIGRCTAELFARRNWRVGLIARGPRALADTCESIRASSGQAAYASADVTDSALLSVAAETLTNALGPIDLWINCAGNGVYGRFADVPEREFRQVTDVTYHGVVNGTRVALDHMRKRGRGHIINVCSAVAYHGMPMVSSYAGAKAAVRGFTQAVAAELRQQKCGVKVTTVFPPGANTPFFSHAVSHLGRPARPAWPVYQPEVVAQGVWQAYRSGRAEVAISGTSLAFSLASRLSPDLIAWCMSQLGVEQITSNSSEALRLQAPTLFEPSSESLGVHGPHGRGAKRWSSQLWLDWRRLRRLEPFSSARVPSRVPPAVEPGSRHDPSETYPALAGSDGRPDAS